MIFSFLFGLVCAFYFAIGQYFGAQTAKAIAQIEIGLHARAQGLALCDRFVCGACHCWSVFAADIAVVIRAIYLHANGVSIGHGLFSFFGFD